MSKAAGDTYKSVHIWSGKMSLPNKFCERFVKENAFVAMRWDSTIGVLELSFHHSDGVDFRVPISKHPDRTTLVVHAKFFSQLRPFKIGKCDIHDIDVSPSGKLTLKFKLEKI